MKAAATWVQGFRSSQMRRKESEFSLPRGSQHERCFVQTVKSTVDELRRKAITSLDADEEWSRGEKRPSASLSLRLRPREQGDGTWPQCRRFADLCAHQIVNARVSEDGARSRCVVSYKGNPRFGRAALRTIVQYATIVIPYLFESYDCTRDLFEDLFDKEMRVLVNMMTVCPLLYALTYAEGWWRILLFVVSALLPLAGLTLWLRELSDVWKGLGADLRKRREFNRASKHLMRLLPKAMEARYEFYHVGSKAHR